MESPLPVWELLGVRIIFPSQYRRRSGVLIVTPRLGQTSRDLLHLHSNPGLTKYWTGHCTNCTVIHCKSILAPIGQKNPSMEEGVGGLKIKNS